VSAGPLFVLKTEADPHSKNASFTYFYSKSNYMEQCITFIYFGMTLYMFRTVFPSIIRSSRLYIQQQAYVKMILLLPCAAVCLLASRQQHLFGCCMYSLELLMMDRYCCLIARE